MKASEWEGWMSGDDGPREDNPERETMYKMIDDLAACEKERDGMRDEYFKQEKKMIREMDRADALEARVKVLEEVAEVWTALSMTSIWEWDHAEYAFPARPAPHLPARRPAMSDLREKVMKILEEDLPWDWATDRILSLVERTAVERERKAFVAGALWGITPLSWNEVSEREAIESATRRYPLPKEE